MNIYRTKRSRSNILSTYDRLLKGWGIEVEHDEVQTRYGVTRVNVCGDPEGQPLVLFHGVGDDSALMWIYNAAALGRHFRLYAIDTIGGPGKSVPNANYNKQFDGAVWIDEVLDGLGLKQVNMAGVSHGGYLVQAYTLARPERVGQAVALASSVPAAAAGSPMKTMLRVFLPEALFPTRNNVKKLLVKLTGSNSAAFIGNPLIVEHFTHLLRGYNNMAMAYHKVSGFTDAEIDMLRSRVLYLVGAADPFAVLGGRAALEQYGMNARFFEDVGHGINHEIAEEINGVLIRHLT